MVIGLTLAMAAPVRCDADAAVALMEDARIPPQRVPAIQPNLLPGLALSQGNEQVRQAMADLCTDPRSVSIAESETYEDGTFSASTFLITRSETAGCALIGQTRALTVGVDDQGTLHFDLRGREPDTVTPIGDCDVASFYRDERQLAGDNGPVRVWLVSDHAPSGDTHRVVVRRATAKGWIEQELFSPAPDRLVDGGSGPSLTLTPGLNPLLIAHADRAIDNGQCKPIAGQTVWSWQGSNWEAHTGREALGMLAERGAWRLAGQDGWFVIVAQDRPSDLSLLRARMRQKSGMSTQELKIWESGVYPLMNTGFLIVAAAPYPTESEALQAARAWPRRRGVYVRQGWAAPSGCDDVGY